MTRASAVSCPQALCKDRKCPGEQQGRSEQIPSRDPPAQRPSLAKRQSRGPLWGYNSQAGSRLPWAGNWGLTSSSSTGARVPTVLGQETSPLKPSHAGVLPAPGRGSLEVCSACDRTQRAEPLWARGPALGGSGGRTPPPPPLSPFPLSPLPPLTALLLILAPLALLLEVTQLLRGDTQVTTGKMSCLTESLGLQAGRAQPRCWAPEPRR